MNARYPAEPVFRSQVAQQADGHCDSGGPVIDLSRSRASAVPIAIEERRHRIGGLGHDGGCRTASASDALLGEVR